MATIYTSNSQKEIFPHGLLVERKDGTLVLHCQTTANKEKIKALGAQWNPDTHTWSVSLNANLEPLRSRTPEWVCCSKAHSLDAWNKTCVCEEHYPRGKAPWWFCGHSTAKILSLNLQMHSCESCGSSVFRKGRAME